MLNGLLIANIEYVSSLPVLFLLLLFAGWDSWGGGGMSGGGDEIAQLLCASVHTNEKKKKSKPFVSLPKCNEDFKNKVGEILS